MSFQSGQNPQVIKEVNLLQTVNTVKLPTANLDELTSPMPTGINDRMHETAT
jgi:hypothetical protein